MAERSLPPAVRPIIYIYKIVRFPRRLATESYFQTVNFQCHQTAVFPSGLRGDVCEVACACAARNRGGGGVRGGKERCVLEVQLGPMGSCHPSIGISDVLK